MDRTWRPRLRRSSPVPATAGPAAADPVTPEEGDRLDAGPGAAPAGPEGARASWVVGPTRRTHDDGWDGIEVDVDGRPVRFEVLGNQPADRVEAVLTALVPAALAAGAELSTERPVDRGWLEGVGRASDLMASWWGHAPTAPVAAPSARSGEAHRQAFGVGLCFTSGVDSFWALLRGGHDPTHLVYVIGYDVDHDDVERVQEQVAAVRAVAQAKGLTPVFVRTDLRHHPHAAAVSWERLHGAALAAVGLLLADVIGRLVIPPSYASGRLVPWGSRPDLDPLWTLPGVVDIEHSLTALPRLARVQAVGHDPLVHEHLRVCWEHLTAGANCGRCEKCVRTMVMLTTIGQLEACRTFGVPVALPELIRAVAPLPERHAVMWRDLLTEPLPDDVRAAIDEVAGPLTSAP